MPAFDFSESATQAYLTLYFSLIFGSVAFILGAGKQVAVSLEHNFPLQSTKAYATINLSVVKTSHKSLLYISVDA